MSHLGCPLLGDMLYGKQKIEKVDNKNLKKFIIVTLSTMEDKLFMQKS